MQTLYSHFYASCEITVQYFLSMLIINYIYINRRDLIHPEWKANILNLPKSNLLAY